MHVAQASNGEGTAAVSAAGDAAEREADLLGPQLAAGHDVRATTARSAAVQLRSRFTTKQGETPVENKDGCMELRARLARYFAAGPVVDASYYFTEQEWKSFGGDVRDPFSRPGAPLIGKATPPQTTMSAADPNVVYLDSRPDPEADLQTLNSAGPFGVATMLVGGLAGHGIHRIVRETRFWQAQDEALTALGDLPGHGQAGPEPAVEPRVRNAEREQGPNHADMPALREYEVHPHTSTETAAIETAPVEHPVDPLVEARAIRAAERLRERREAERDAREGFAETLRELRGDLGKLHSNKFLDPFFYAKLVKAAYQGAKLGIRSFDAFRARLAAEKLLSTAAYEQLSVEAKRDLQSAFYDGLGEEAEDIVPRVEYSIADAKTPPLSGVRGTALNRAWKLERELVIATGRGTRGWSDHELAEIRRGAGFVELGYTGHHINRVAERRDWQGDPRNIEFLRQGSGDEHMADGHPGGTRAAQAERPLIDRQAMIDQFKQGKK